MSAASIVPRLCVITTNCVRSVSSRSACVKRPTFRSSSAASTSSSTQNGAGRTRRMASSNAVAVRARSRPESDEPTAEPLQSRDGARLLLFIRLVVERDACRIRQRLVLGKAEFRAHLLLEQSQRTGGALLLNGGLAPLPAELGEPLARLCQTLLGLAPRALRGERTLPRELGRARGFLRLSRRSSEFVLRGLEATTRIPLLRDERTKARLLFGDAPFRGTDLLAERVAHADRGAAALLHRRRLEARFLGALRSGVVRIDRYLLAALGC